MQLVFDETVDCTAAEATSSYCHMLYSCWIFCTTVCQPYHMSKLAGEEWVKELILGHPDRVYAELGVRVHVFLVLVVSLV